MKANEAPEKIYLEREKETDRIHHLWGRTPVISSLYEHIEYIRKDAFIEKACDYFMEYEFNDSPTIADRRKRVGEFRKYMERE